MEILREQTIMNPAPMSSQQTEVKLRVLQQPEEEADTKPKIQQLLQFWEVTENWKDGQREREQEREMRL